MWGPNQQLPLSQSGQSVGRVLGLVKCCGRVRVWVGHVQTKRRQKARARPPGGPVESRNSHARRAESGRWRGEGGAERGEARKRREDETRSNIWSKRLHSRLARKASMAKQENTRAGVNERAR